MFEGFFFLEVQEIRSLTLKGGFFFLRVWFKVSTNKGIFAIKKEHY
jgi:hypothetical protein